MYNCKYESKGGVGKTTTTVNLVVGLVGTGKRVIWVDADPQGNLTVSLGVKQPDELPISIDSVMQSIIEDRPVSEGSGIIRHEESIDLLSANIELFGLDVSLFNTMSRKFVLKHTGSVQSEERLFII